ncbi:probable prolyl 4-hydroxylase 6 [Dioscorea cayenensis subsp. rotundata]|uniref:procollagen-proline 4-dioxygenase n=1 Tax=Dioscorea cayennensis subsp. rotundata TaxID=55577 RepID=A0AB40CU03_DIOCR|nr:probable prolyl 4-hydroxylase 6 [Dioscorea cayenensis subsp. rotundata]
MASLLSIPLLLLILANSQQICSTSRFVDLETKREKLDLVQEKSHIIKSTQFNPAKVTQLSWHPRLFLCEGFLSDKESDHLIALAQNKLQKASAINIGSGKNTHDLQNNTNSCVSLARDFDEIVSIIEKRIAAWTFLPKENGEDMQILHYDVNNMDAIQYDNYNATFRPVYGGHRIATILIFLSTVTHGGETIFPMSVLKDTQIKDSRWSDCAANGYAVKPVKGDALLVFNLHPNATLDFSSFHGDCKVLEGEKWIAIKQIHVKTFVQNQPLIEFKDDCTDEDDSCSQWAAIGECQRNPVYMLGTPDYYGTCRKSCGAC